jgi:flavin-dependent dehydrogenase
MEVPFFPSPSAKVRYGAFERQVTLSSPVNVIRREDFDANLVDQVRRRNVDIVEGEGVKEYRLVGDHVEVLTSKGRTLQADVLIGADGAASVVRKQLLDNEKALPHRLFKLEMAIPAGRDIDPSMLYDFSLMRSGLRGYLWVFPVPGDLINVGLMHYPTYRTSGVELIRLLRAGLAELGIDLPDKGSRGWPAWGYHPKKRVAGPRVLTVGDAAGIDGLTGEGIAVAMEHAIEAGDAIAEAYASGDFSFAGYRKRIRRAVVGRELALDRWLARLLYRSKRWQSWLSLVLYDPDVLEMYAARVSGSEILADQKGRLWRALAKHLWRMRGRRRKLIAAGNVPAQLPAPGERVSAGAP